MAILEDERFPYLHTGYYEFFESIANSDLADDVESGGLDFPASIEMKSFLYEDMGSSLIDNYEFLVSKPTLQQVEDGAYGGSDHFIPIQEQSSSTSFLNENKGSSLAGYYELLDSNATSQQVEEVAYGGPDHGIPIQNQSSSTCFLYEDKGSSLAGYYELLDSNATLHEVEDVAYGGPDHGIPIQNQSSCTSFLYEDKGSSIAGYYELLDNNATLQQVEDVAYGGPDRGIPIQNQRSALKVEGEHKCKRSFTEFITYNSVATHGLQTNSPELGMRNSNEYMGSSPTDSTLLKVDDVANGGPKCYMENKRQRLMKIEDENEWQRSYRELVVLCQY